MAEDRIPEMPRDGGHIEEPTAKVPGSDVRNGTRPSVNISSKNGAISVSIARRDAHTKEDARVPITVPFGVTIPNTFRYCSIPIYFSFYPLLLLCLSLCVR
jgi:hypothetical protein